MTSFKLILLLINKRISLKYLNFVLILFFFIPIIVQSQVGQNNSRSLTRKNSLLINKKINPKEEILSNEIKLLKYYIEIGDYNQVFSKGNNAEKIALELNDFESLSKVYQYKAHAASVLGLYEDANNHLNKAIHYTNKINTVYNRQIRLSAIYANYAGMYEGENNQDSILYFAKKNLDVLRSVPIHALDSLQKANYYQMLIYAELSMAGFYTHIATPARLDLAQPYFDNILKYKETHTEYFNALDLEIYRSLGSFYLKKKQFEKSCHFHEIALEIEKKKKNPRLRLFIYDDLKATYDSLKDTEKLTHYLKLFTNLNDSINRSEKQAIITQSIDKINKNEENIKTTKTKIITLSAVTSLFLTGLIFIIFYYRNKKIKQKYNSLVNKLEQNIQIQNQSFENFNSNHSNQKQDALINNISEETTNKLLKKLLAFEESHKYLNSDINLTSLAYQLNTNPRYLSEIIRTHKGLNFNSYIHHLRINYILQKLYKESKYRNYKISSLAEMSGYVSVQVFVNSFKKITGVAPSYFIEKLNENNGDNQSNENT